jgi:hypothetical protein
LAPPNRFTMANHTAPDLPHVKMLAALRHAQLKALPSLVKSTDGSAVSEQDLAGRLEQCVDAMEDLTNHCWHQRKDRDDWFHPQYVAKTFSTYCWNAGRKFSQVEVDSITRQALLALAVLEAEIRFFPGVHGEPVPSSIADPQTPYSTSGE